jgi:hypothetical protein
MISAESQKRFEFSISLGKKRNIKLKKEIDSFFDDEYGFEIPTNKKTLEDFLTNLKKVDETEYLKAKEITRISNILRFGYSVGALFPGTHGQFQTVTLGHTYTRHRLCHIWNYRKARIIRKTYFNFIRENIEHLQSTYKPVHIVLTLKRDKEGLYKGQKFYGSELAKQFNQMRKKLFWKIFVGGGEYGIETKKAKTVKGLHTHIHSFSLLYKNFNWIALRKASQKEIVELIRFFEPEYKVKKGYKHMQHLKEKLKWSGFRIGLFRAMVRHYWHKMTDSNQIHVEKLYTFKRDENGKFEFQYINTPEGVKQVRVKDYIHENSTPEHYTAGILECIKYHFKPDTIKNEKGNFDIPLILEILLNTKGQRLYSRFGILYKIQSLNFSKLEKEGDPDILRQEKPDENEDFEPVLKTQSIRETLGEICNPWTGEKAEKNDFALCLFDPLNRRHSPINAVVDAFTSKETKPEKVYFIVEENQKFADLFKMLNTIPLPNDTGEASVYNFSDKFYKPIYEKYQSEEMKSKFFIFAETNPEQDFWTRINLN